MTIIQHPTPRPHGEAYRETTTGPLLIWCDHCHRGIPIAQTKGPAPDYAPICPHCGAGFVGGAK